MFVTPGKEELKEGFNFEELAKETEGYSGSDLKNLCVAAAYRPIREIIEVSAAGYFEVFLVAICYLGLPCFQYSSVHYLYCTCSTTRAVTI
jgi:SpoVK/Ycf46/Vps4 family AAA+-type ATPase